MRWVFQVLLVNLVFQELKVDQANKVRVVKRVIKDIQEKKAQKENKVIQDLEVKLEIRATLDSLFQVLEDQKVHQV